LPTYFYIYLSGWLSKADVVMSTKSIDTILHNRELSMSGSVADQIAALNADITALNTQIAIDLSSNPPNTAGAAALQLQVSADVANIASLNASLCLARDTHVLTDRGEVLVQDLKVGDLVVTPHGASECMPIRWIGRQRYTAARMVYGQPVLVRAGALGNGLPHRDLRLSADHSVFLDGHLVPVRLLVNAISIIAETHHTEIEYFNPEFDQHTVLIAEGMETETYLDCGNRPRFDNFAEPSAWLASRPSRDGSAWVDGSAFAPLLWEGPKLAALRTRLTNLAVHLAMPLPANAAPREAFTPAFIIANPPSNMPAA
jgi:hypothetical protein